MGDALFYIGAGVGLATVLWFTFGLAATFAIKKEMPDDIPFGVLVRFYILSSFMVPYILFKFGSLPRGIGVTKMEDEQ